MLVLSRYPDKRTDAQTNEIVIGGDIRVYVLEVRGDKVRIGVAAPPGVDILRAELERGDDE